MRSFFAQASKAADALLLCGDLSDYGTAEEAHVLADKGFAGGFGRGSLGAWGAFPRPSTSCHWRSCAACATQPPKAATPFNEGGTLGSITMTGYLLGWPPPSAFGSAPARHLVVGLFRRGEGHGS